MIRLTRQTKRLLPQGIVAEIGPAGVALRRVRGRKRHTVTWDQIASLTAKEDDQDICLAAEKRLGAMHIHAMGGS